MWGRPVLIVLSGLCALVAPGCSMCAPREFRFGGSAVRAPSRPGKEEAPREAARILARPPAEEVELAAAAPEPAPPARPPERPRRTFPDFPWPRRQPERTDPEPGWELREGFLGLRRRLEEVPGEALLRWEAEAVLLANRSPLRGLTWADLPPLPPDAGPWLPPEPERVLAGRSADLVGFLFRPGPGAPLFLVPSLWSLRQGRTPELHERVLVASSLSEEAAGFRPIRLTGFLRVRAVRSGGVLVGVYVLEPAVSEATAGPG